MIPELPAYVNIVFILTTLLTLGFLYYLLVRVERNNKQSMTALSVVTFLGLWLFVTAALSVNDFFLNFDGLPPRFLLAIGPPLIAVVVLLSIKKSREYVMDMSIVTLTYLHVVRIPVEFVLLWLYREGHIPELMTFEGRNFDILAGMSAPIVAYFALSQIVKATAGALIWNFICLGLLLNIVINAILSIPYPFQVQAFDQPNVAVFYFPFIWLPAFIVPAVLFAHLAGIIKLLKGRV